MVIHDLWSMRGDHKHSIVANARNNHSYIKRNKCLRIAGMLASFNLFLIALVTVFPIQLRHMTAEATEDASSTPSLTMIQGHESASVNLLVSSSTGTFATSSTDQLAEFSVASSNQSGYTLTIVGNDDEGALKDSNTNNALSTITDRTSISAFDNSIFNGKWGYRPSKYNSVTNEDFYPSPTTEASTLDKTNRPNQETPNVYTIGLGARADYSTSAGSYTGSYTLQAIGNVVPYTIYFVDDTNDSTVANLPTSIIGSTQDSTITLPSTLPTRTGYTFGGWCSVLTTLDASGNSVCSGGTLYDRGGEFPISQLSFSESTLHTTWTRDNYNVVVKFQGEGVESVTFSASGRPSQTVSTSDDTVSLTYGIEYTVNANIISDNYELVGWGINNPNYGALSSMTSNPTTFTPNENSGSAELTAVGKLALSSLQEMVIQDCPATPTLVYDTRDNEKYYIQKLADGNCWMLDNLRLGSDTEIGLTPQDTNITTNYTLPASVKGGTATNAIAMLNADYKNDDTKRYYGEGSGKLGVFYNYCASSAGGFCVQASSSGTPFTQPDYDICPKGWRLPTGGTAGEYQDLYTAYSNDSIAFLTALSMPFSGYYSFSSSGSLEYPNSYGYLRPSTLLNATSASVVYSAYPSTVSLNSSVGPYHGNPIRCFISGKDYTIALDNSTATTPGSTSVTVNNGDDTVSITNPSRTYSVSGFSTEYNDASGATVSSTNTLSYDYQFNGWYTSLTNGAKVINIDGSFVPNTHYTNSIGKWIGAANPTFYAGWDLDDAPSLPVISKPGYVCGWTTQTNSKVIMYASGYNGLMPTSDTTLYGVCSLTHDITVNFAGANISSVVFTFPGQITRTVSASGGTAILIEGLEYTVTMNTPNDSAFKSWTLNNTNYGTLSSTMTNPTSFTPNSNSDNAVITATSITKIGDMQNLDYSLCTTTPAAVVDTRDNQIYTVQKLADGNCWMMNNLNLGATTLTEDLTSSNTNIDSTVTADSFNSWKKYPYPSASSEVGEYMPIEGFDSVSGTAYGTLYNYCAASAGTYCMSSTTVEDNDPQYDICPKGWRLPTGGSTGEFQALYSNSNYNTISKMRASTDNGGAAFAIPGYFYASSPNIGSGGYYWSSTHSSTSVYIMYLTNASINAQYWHSRNYGYSIRCVLDTMPKYTINLTNTSATTTGSTSARAIKDRKIAYAGTSGTYNITNPSRTYTVSGFDTTYNNASGASVSSTSNRTSSYSFDGWYTSPTGGTKIIATNSTFVPSTEYADSEGKWVGDSDITLYARWGSGNSVTLPTITKTGYTCGWTTSTNTDTITYASGYSGFIPTESMTLHGVCTVNSYKVKVDFASTGISSVSFEASGYPSVNVTTSGNTASLVYNVPYTMTMNFNSGYEFQSWALNSTSYGTLSNTSTNPTTFTIRAYDNGVITANGKQTPVDINKSMQGLSSSSCTTTPSLVTDTRDNQEYVVQRLADGNCWMLDNLRLGSTDITTDLTSENTNLSSTIPASTWNSYRTTSGFNSYTASMFNSASANDTTTNYGSGSGKTGVYYNYCAASADTYCATSGSGSGDTSYDICPKGWRMPTSGSNGEYKSLYTAYSSDTANFRMALSITLSGSFMDSYVSNKGNVGDFWSSTYNSGSSMYKLRVQSSSVYPADNDPRNRGLAIRCILNAPIPESSITLTNTSATTTGSTIAKAISGSKKAYDGTSGTTNITNPSRQYTVSGFSTSYNNASGASVSSTSNRTSSYSFDGWYTSPTGGTKIIASDSSFIPNTSYADSEGRWTSDSDLTLYAGWGAGDAVTLPTISKSGYTCGWTTSTNTSSIMYASGYSGLVPTANMTLYGVCTASTHSVRVNFAGSGVSSVTFTASGQTSRTVSTSGGTASLIEGVQYTVTMNLSSGSSFDSWALNSSSYGTLSSTSTNPTYFTPNSSSANAVITASGKEDCSGTISGYMQNYSPSDNLCVGTVGTLTDNRDNKQYKVAKLADGNIWMLDNLALGSNSSISLTPSNTNINTNWTLPASTPSDFDSYTAAKIVNDYSDTTVTKYGEGSGKVGVYYNYCAASAGTYCYAKDTSGHNDIQYDICPKGWHIPSGGSNGEAKALYNSYSTSSQRRIAYSVALSGVYQNDEGTWEAWGQNGYSSIWTSTADNDNNIIYTMDSNGSDAGSGTANYMGARNSGLSIRCMLNI